MRIEKELLSSFYEELYDSIGEKGMLEFYRLYGGLTLNVPKKIYDSRKVKSYLRNNYLEKKLTKADLKNLVYMFGYSERYIRKLLSK